MQRREYPDDVRMINSSQEIDFSASPLEGHIPVGSSQLDNFQHDVPTTLLASSNVFLARGREGCQVGHTEGGSCFCDQPRVHQALPSNMWACPRFYPPITVPRTVLPTGCST